MKMKIKNEYKFEGAPLICLNNLRFLQTSES